MNSFKGKNEVPKMFGDWEKQAKELKTIFPQLTDVDLKFEEGKENELIKRLELRLNKKREEVIYTIKQTQTEKF